MNISPFSPEKVLLYYPLWKQVYAWYERMEKGGFSHIPLPPPITVSTDLTAHCNMKCIGCNADRVLTENNTQLNKDWLFSLSNTLAWWGVKGNCLGGGGESTLSPFINDFVESMYKNDIGVGIVSNGLTLKKLNPKHFKWVGVSVDAGTKEVWSKVHGVRKELFDKVLDGMKYLIDNGVQTTYKYLVRPENVDDVLEGITQANALKCFAFHLRPMASPWFADPSKQLFSQVDVEKVQDALASGKKSFPNFRIEGVFNKLGDTWQVVHPFEKCWSIFATCVFQSNKKVGLCCDCRGNPLVEVGPFDDPGDFVKFWGSKEHFDIQKNINIDKCSRCTFSCLNKLFEGAVIQDGFMSDFI